MESCDVFRHVRVTWARFFFFVCFFAITAVQADVSEAVLPPPASGSARASLVKPVQGSAAGVCVNGRLWF